MSSVMSRRALGVAVFLALSTAALASAAGEPHHGGQLHQSTTTEGEHHNILAVKGIGGATIRDGLTEEIYGPGLVWEHTLIEQWLDLEVSAAALFSPGEIIVPIDVLLKKPFHLGRVVTLFIGAGPSLTIIPEDGHVVFGGIISAGGYFWLGENFGLLAEVDYAIGADHGAVNDLEVAAGVAWRFW